MQTGRLRREIHSMAAASLCPGPGLYLQIIVLVVVLVVVAFSPPGGLFGYVAPVGG